MPRKQKDNTPVDPREAELVEDMTLDCMDYIYGKGADAIVKALSESTDTSKTMATIVYKAVSSSAHQRKATATVAMDMDMMMGVTTACIDMSLEVAQAAGQVMEGSNVQQLKEDVLLKTVVMHGEQLERTPEQKEMAMADLRDYTVSPGYQNALNYVNKRASNEGLNPKDMERAGNEAFFGTQTPTKDALSAGIDRGLMEKHGMPEPPPPAPEANGEMVPSATDAPPQEQGLMGQEEMVPPQPPNPLPTGPGIAPVPGGPPPPQDPSAEIAPAPGRVQ